jgi:inosine/xanthosine triphosphatase
MISMLVAVGSLNPVKINAVKQAFEKVFPEDTWNVQGVAVKSGIPDQPMNDRQSIRGARNRARRAMKTLQADYGVGLEGGLHKIGKQWFDTGWMVIIDKQGNEGVGSTIRMKTPDVMMKHIHAGMELGQVNDLIFKKNNSKQANGHFGLMTNDAITRTSAYVDGLVAALVAFIHPNLFEE